MTKQQYKILKKFTDRPAMSYQDLVMRLGDGNEALFRVYKSLKDMGYISLCPGEEEKSMGDAITTDAKCRITQAGISALEEKRISINGTIRARVAFWVAALGVLFAALAFFLK